MHRLAVLKFCRDELADREKRDEWQGWFWGIRRKVLDYWIAVLERASSSSGEIPELGPDERRTIRCGHPLLAAREPHSGSAPMPERDWQAELHRRVAVYIEALRAHR